MEQLTLSVIRDPAQNTTKSLFFPTLLPMATAHGKSFSSAIRPPIILKPKEGSERPHLERNDDKYPPSDAKLSYWNYIDEDK